MLSSIPYATLANFSPRGTSALSKRSQQIKDAIKAANSYTIQSSLKYFDDSKVDTDPLVQFLGKNITLVPVPRSSPLRDGSLWPSLVIAEIFMEGGYGGSILPCISRITAVRKSTTSGRGNRPTVPEHHESFSVDNRLFQPTNITLVDDVLTKGSTMFACAMRLHDAFPEVEIRAFAMLRTQGFLPNISKFVDPSTGKITYDYETGDIDRMP